ncbi:DUF6477 family protein [Vannielia sp.]|uniref:DUF6477 family protein n=1 Tax=Vannielia sp. TaxID=2813045 RepID=UPI00262BF78B|nr:DUF6477 family protein [Vannielia sp.]MDF1872633.1 DUF6477 family protein [Vannielia sp.]
MHTHSTEKRNHGARDPLGGLKRPRLLVRAARLGLADYSRKRDLGRILRETELPGPSTALPRLIEEEADMEARRQGGLTTYSVIHHLEVLIALMAEVRLVPRWSATGG